LWELAFGGTGTLAIAEAVLKKTWRGRYDYVKIKRIPGRLRRNGELRIIIGVGWLLTELHYSINKHTLQRMKGSLTSGPTDVLAEFDSYIKPFNYDYRIPPR